MIAAVVGSNFRIVFMIDSGADINVIAENVWEEMHDYIDKDEMIFDYDPKPNRKVFAFASDKPLSLLATFNAWLNVEAPGKPMCYLKFFVIKGSERSIIGRDSATLLKILKVGIEVNNITLSSEREDISFSEFPKIPNEVVHFDIDPNVVPKKNAYYHIPAAFSKQANERLLKMIRQGVIEKVKKAPKWISGMCAVPKGQKDFRLVVNMKAPNKAIQRCYYKLPTLEEIQRKLAGSKYFAKLDLTNAFHHVEIDEESRELTTFMAEDGMYRFTRLVFGVNCAPEKFQEIMERLFSDINFVVIFIDDILIYARTLEELKERTRTVISILKQNNLTLNMEKCEFEKENLSFLGHRISEVGMSINEEKVKAIRNFKQPETISELRSFLGLANYVACYIANFANITSPLWKMTSQKSLEWTEEASRAFQETKRAIMETTVTNGFFDDLDQTYIYTDASPVALGTVLTQKNPIGDERIISIASKMLTATEMKYPQTQREALGIVWAVEHYHYFLRGRRFTIRTDARGIAFIFNQERDLSKRVISRAQGFALRLNEFDFEIEFVNGNKNIADPPSRLYQGNDQAYEERDGPWEIGSISCEFDNDSTIIGEITLERISSETATDVIIQHVFYAIGNNNWSNPTISKYKCVKDELHTDGEILMKGGVIVLPSKLTREALELAHTGHPGATTMRSILKNRIWWPGIDRDSKRYVETCLSCTLTSKKSPPEPMTRALLPSGVWDIVAVDFNGPYRQLNDGLILAIVDCYSRYLICSVVKSTNFNSVNVVFDDVFNRYGFPKSIKSDNGPPFNGEPYKQYCRSRDIKVVFSTPLFPQQNGMIERYMQLINKSMQISTHENTNPAKALTETIRAHNSAKHRITQVAPEELMFNRKIRRLLPLASAQSYKVNHNPSEIRKRDFEEKHRSKVREDIKRGARDSQIRIGDRVVILRGSKSKGETRYEPTAWQVIEKTRGDLVLRDQKGKETKRNVSMVKKIFERDIERTEIGESIGSTDNTTTNNDVSANTTTGNEHGDSFLGTEGENNNIRPQRMRKEPTYLSDFIREIS